MGGDEKGRAILKSAIAITPVRKAGMGLLPLQDARRSPGTPLATPQAVLT